MAYLQLRTRCGCSRVIKWDGPPPPHYDVPLTASRGAQTIMEECSFLEPFTVQVRTFNLRYSTPFTMDGVEYYAYEED